MTKTYNRNDYKYKCTVCNTVNFIDIDESCEEVEFGYQFDDNKNFHYHDFNSGIVELLCENGHKTMVKYITSCECECGWNTIDLEKYSCETFKNSKQVFLNNLFDSDEDDW